MLKRHGIVEKDGDLIRLNVEKLSLQEKAEVRKICEERLQSFIAKRGLGIWDYRMLEDDPVPDDLRYQVLKESGGRCALCGATSKEAILHVDHIQPRSRGGTNEIFKRCVTAAISGKEIRTLPIFAPGIQGQAQDSGGGVIPAYPRPGVWAIPSS